MNGLVRRLRRIPQLPLPPSAGVIGQNRKAQPLVFRELLCFCLLSALFKNFLCWRSVRVNAEVCRKPLGGFVKRQIKKVCGKVNHVPMCAAGKTKTMIVCHIQAGVPVVVKRTEGFALPVDRYPVPFRSFPTAHAILDVLKKVHAVSSAK